MAQNPGLLTVPEVARRLATTPSSVRRWIAEGVLPAVRLPGRAGLYRIRESDVDLILNGSATVEPAAAADTG